MEGSGGLGGAVDVGADGVGEEIVWIDRFKGDGVVGGGDAGRQRHGAEVEEALERGIVDPHWVNGLLLESAKPVTGLPWLPLK